MSDLASALAHMQWRRNKTGRQDVDREKLQRLNGEPEGWTATRHVVSEWTETFAGMSDADVDMRFLAPMWDLLTSSIKAAEKFPSNILGYTDDIAPRDDISPRDGALYRTITVYANGEPLPMLPEPVEQAA